MSQFKASDMDTPVNDLIEDGKVSEKQFKYYFTSKMVDIFEKNNILVIPSDLVGHIHRMIKSCLDRDVNLHILAGNIVAEIMTYMNVTDEERKAFERHCLEQEAKEMREEIEK